jgi:stage V sporulation protein G
MEITEVRIKLMENPEDRLRGFCSITFDGSFVIRDLKIIEGNNGPFVAMPSRKLTSNCRKCRSKNHLKANYCNQCGAKVQQERVLHDSSGRAKLYADIAHPINAECREMIQRRIVDELHNEQKLAKEPGYRSRYDEGYDDGRHASKPHKSRGAAISSTAVRQNVAASQSDDKGRASVEADGKSSEQAEAKSSENAGLTEVNGDDLDGPSEVRSAASPIAMMKGINDDRLGDATISNGTIESVAKSQMRVVNDSDDLFGKGVFDV